LNAWSERIRILINGTRRVCVFVWLVVFVICLGSTGVGEVPDKDTRSQAFTFTMVGKKAIHYKVFSFDKVRPGDTLKATVLVNNDTTADVRFEKVDLACKCTTAQVPMISLPNGDSVEMSFRIVTPSSPRKPDERFSAVVWCSGKDMVQLTFQVRYEGLVAFAQPEINVPFLKTEDERSFRLPLEFESPELMQKIRIETSDDLKPIRSKLVRDGDKYFVECRFMPSEIRNGSALGEIVIISPTGFTSNILCKLSENQDVEILPNRTVFTVGETKEIPRHATAIVRMRVPSPEKPTPNILRIECRSPQDMELETSFSQLSKNTYRVKIQSHKLEELSSDGILKWKILTDLGLEIEVETKCVLSN